MIQCKFPPLSAKTVRPSVNLPANTTAQAPSSIVGATLGSPNTHQPKLPHLVTPFTSFRASVWITHIVTWSGPAHRSQASMGGPPPEADKRLSVGYDVLTLR